MNIGIIVTGMLTVVGWGAFAHFHGEHKKARAANDAIKENYLSLFRAICFVAACFATGFFSLAALPNKNNPGGIPPFIGLIYGGYFLFMYFAVKCPNCKRRNFKNERISRDHLGDREISKYVTRSSDVKNNYGQVIGTVEHKELVYGQRHFFLETYQCADCLHRTEREVFEDDYRGAA